MLRKFKVAVVVRTLVRIGCERTEVRATLKSCRRPNFNEGRGLLGFFELESDDALDVLF